MDNFKEKKCGDKDCDNKFKQFNSLQRYCSTLCSLKNKNPEKVKVYVPIKKVSKKRQIENVKYSVLRLEFLGQKENQICFIDECNRKANSVEHIMGRKGFADEYARQNNISLYLDVRFWKPCCLECNLELENNSELSKKYQLSKITGKSKI